MPPELDVFLDFVITDDRPTFILGVSAPGALLRPHIILRNAALEELFTRTGIDSSFDGWVHGIGLSVADAQCGAQLASAGTFAGRDWNIKSLGYGWRAVFCSQKPYRPGQQTTARDPPQDTDLGGTVQHVHPDRSVQDELDTESDLQDLVVDALRFSQASADPFISFVRDYDWSKTNIGPINKWHPVLRQYAVSILACPEPRVLYWGNDMKLLYNEAAVPVMGKRHPFCLGLPTAASWGDEVVAQITQTVRLGLKQGKPLHIRSMEFILERNGFPEQTFHDYQIIPISSYQGYFLGCIAEFSETTGTVVQKARSRAIARAKEEAATTNELAELWPKLLAVVDPNASLDVSYALLYLTDNIYRVTEDASLVPKLSVERPAKRNKSDPSTSFHFHASRGASDPAAVQKAPYVLAEAFGNDSTRQDVVVLQQGKDLPTEFATNIQGRGMVRYACLLPITDFEGHCLAFVVLGMNPRRPFDDDTRLFTQTLRDTFSRVAAALCITEVLQQGSLNPMYRNAPIGMFKARPDGSPIFVNSTYLELLNVDRAEISGTLGWLDIIAEEDKQSSMLAWQTLQSGITGTWEFRLKDRLDSPSNRPRHLEAMAIPELDKDGKVESIHGWVTDITHRKLTESLMAQRLKDALETEKASERFIDTLSHELRNPLSAILQLADGILASVKQESGSFSTEVTASISDAAETITLCAQHQHGIVNDILTLSKLDSNLVVLSPEVVQVPPILDKAVRMFDVELVKANIELYIRTRQSYADLGLDHVSLDSGRLLQIVINLLTNAIKFTRDSSVRRIKIELGASLVRPTGESCGTTFIIPRARRNSNAISSLARKPSTTDKADVYLVFDVQDTGPGMTEEEMSHLFYRFAQASPKTYRQYGGSGLGLFICRELIELQGGQIGLHSEPGVGSTFTFYIAATRAQAPEPIRSPPILAVDNSMSVEVCVKDMHILRKYCLPDIC